MTVYVTMTMYPGGRGKRPDTQYLFRRACPDSERNPLPSWTRSRKQSVGFPSVAAARHAIDQIYEVCSPRGSLGVEITEAAITDSATGPPQEWTS